MAIGLKLNNGGNITGFSSPVAPDRGFTKETKPNVLLTKFGDGYEQRKVKGITICTSPYDKAAEIGISAETIKQGNQYSTLTKSSGGYSRIQNEDLIGDIGSSFFSINKKGQYCASPPCCLFGACSNTSEQTFFIDVSGSMGWCYVKGKNCMDAHICGAK